MAAPLLPAPNEKGFFGASAGGFAVLASGAVAEDAPKKKALPAGADGGGAVVAAPLLPAPNEKGFFGASVLAPPKVNGFDAWSAGGAFTPSSSLSLPAFDAKPSSSGCTRLGPGLTGKATFDAAGPGAAGSLGAFEAL